MNEARLNNDAPLSVVIIWCTVMGLHQHGNDRLKRRFKGRKGGWGVITFYHIVEQLHHFQA